MATHKREAVLDALVAQLKAGETMAGQNWFRSRTFPLAKNEIPGGIVRLPPGQMAEEIRRLDGVMFEDRFLTVFLVMKLSEVPEDSNNPTLETNLNLFDWQVEKAIQADPTLGDVVIDTQPTGFFTDMQGAGLDFGDGVLVVRIHYRTLRTDASLP